MKKYANYISETLKPGRTLSEEFNKDYHDARVDHHYHAMNSHDIKGRKSPGESGDYHHRDHGHLPGHHFDDEHTQGTHVTREHGGQTYHGPGGGKVTNFHHEHVYQHGGQKGTSYHSPLHEKSVADVHKIVKKSNPHMSDENAAAAAKHIFNDHKASS